MGSMGSMEPINFGKRVLEPINIQRQSVEIQNFRKFLISFALRVYYIVEKD